MAIVDFKYEPLADGKLAIYAFDPTSKVSEQVIADTDTGIEDVKAKVQRALDRKANTGQLALLLDALGGKLDLTPAIVVDPPKEPTEREQFIQLVLAIRASHNTLGLVLKGFDEPAATAAAQTLLDAHPEFVSIVASLA